MARLGDVCDILNGFAFRSEEYVESGIRIIRIANVQKGYIEDSSPVFYPDDSKEAKKYALVDGDLLISLTGNVGRVAIIGADFLPAALNQRVGCLRPKDGTLSKSFLFHYLNSDTFEQLCISASKGVAQKNMSTEWLKEYKIPLLPLETQRHITTVLDIVTNLISLRKRQLAKLDELVKARFVEMFGDPMPSWPLVTIGDMCTNTRTGPFGSALHHDEFVDGGIFVLGIDNAVENKFSYNRMRYITEEKYQQLKRYTVHPGDVIITIMGTIGRSAVIPEDMPVAINTKHLACLTPDCSKVSSVFLCSAFQMHPEVQRQLTGNTKGAIMDGLNLGIIKSLRFQLPPTQVQKDFELFYAQIDKSKLTIQQGLDKLELLKKALMQKYFG